MRLEDRASARRCVWRNPRAWPLLLCVATLVLAAVGGCSPDGELPEEPASSSEETSPAPESMPTTGAKAPWQPTTLEFSYGESEEMFGYSPGAESDETLPDAIAVSPSGRMFVTDPAKGRIVILDASGGYLGSMTRPGAQLLFGVAWMPWGVVTIDWWAGPEAVLFDEEGALVAAYPVDPGFTHSISMVQAASSGVWVFTPGGWAQVMDGSGDPVPVANQPGTLQEGMPAGSHVYEAYAPFAAPAGTGGRVVRQATGEEPELIVDLGEPDASTVRVLGEDAEGDFYVEVATEDSARCLVYDANGLATADFDLEPGSRMGGHWVAGDGTLYQLVADEHSVRIITYAP